MAVARYGGSVNFSFFLPMGGASVNLVSNGGVNDAVGGATSGTLNLTQTAIGVARRFAATPATGGMLHAADDGGPQIKDQTVQ